MNGIILFEGRSALDPATPIVVIATGLRKSTANLKTGDMIQVWILLRDIHPALGLDGEDQAICGSCPHRKNPETGKRTCYVNIMGPSSVWRSYQKGNYPHYNPVEHDSLFVNRKIRWGAYGDPVNIPLNIVDHLSGISQGHTGYTHQWYLPKFQEYREFFQASVDNTEEYLYASDRLGWGTFRVAAVGVMVNTNEVACQGGIKTDCSRCGLCAGTSNRLTSVVIEAHGINKSNVKG